ncbi:MAG: aspartate carbamoyltransferase regulatory subunit [Clostridia bacterium]|nr:aspartate carbamoyltransferase regulatory subunit [Clostridia bacterium]
MKINPITNGIVLDHITAGKGMELYNILNLDKLDCSVAIIRNADSQKFGKKDIIKIDRVIDLNFDVIGYVDPGVTVNIIKDGVQTKMGRIGLPATVTGIIKCKNPRCITSTEQELVHSFKLCDEEKRVYRCIYCDSVAK